MYNKLDQLQKEGIKGDPPRAVQESIDILSTMKPLPALKWNADLTQAAKYRVHDIEINKLYPLGHTGSKGLGFDHAITKYMKNPGVMAENLAGGVKVPRNLIKFFMWD